MDAQLCYHFWWLRGTICEIPAKVGRTSVASLVRLLGVLVGEAMVELDHLWHLLAGLTGAFGNQVLYWRVASREISGRRVFVSVSYVIVGAGLGFFVGVSSLGFVGSHLLALGAGYCWPETVKAIDAAKNVPMLVMQRLRRAGASCGPDPAGSNDGDAAS